MSKKFRNLHKYRWYFLFGLLILTAIAGLWSLKLKGQIKGLVSTKKEVERPANMEIISITTPDCSQCQQIADAFERVIPQRINVKFVSQKQLAFGGEEAQKLIEKFQIKKVPALILSGEIDKDEQIKQTLASLGEEREGSIVIAGVAPPYQVVDTKEIVGEFKVVYLTDNACGQCYDVNIHKNVLASLGMFPFEEETVDKNTASGRRLIRQYSVEKTPTILLEGDLTGYPRLNEAWQNVGKIADDGTYIFEAVEQLGTYRDLSQNKIVDPQKQKSQVVHSHINFLVFLQGEQFDFAQNSNRYFEKDQSVHLEASTIRGADGKVIHVHANGITMRDFLNTLGWKLTNTCLTTDQKGQFCSGEGKTLKVFRNGSREASFGNQELKENDKYLISFGDESETGVQEQVKQISDYAF